MSNSDQSVFGIAETMTHEVVDVPTMTNAEARDTVTKIQDGIIKVRSLVLTLYERRGWEALGYTSWRACLASEFGAHERTLYRELEAARIERTIWPMGQIGEIPERQLRPLVSLRDDPEAVRSAWAEANERTGGRPTAKVVRSIVAEMRPKPKLKKLDSTNTDVTAPPSVKIPDHWVEWKSDRSGPAETTVEVATPMTGSKRGDEDFVAPKDTEFLVTSLAEALAGPDGPRMFEEFCHREKLGEILRSLQYHSDDSSSTISENRIAELEAECAELEAMCSELEVKLAEAEARTERTAVTTSQPIPHAEDAMPIDPERRIVSELMKAWMIIRNLAPFIKSEGGWDALSGRLDAASRDTVLNIGKMLCKSGESIVTTLERS